MSKFCPECGVNLSSLSSKPEPPTNKTSFQPFAVGKDDDDDDSYLDTMEHLQIKQSELQVEIVKDKPLGESVGAVISQGIQAGSPPTIDEARPARYTDSKVCLEEFQKEAGTIRK